MHEEVFFFGSVACGLLFFGSETREEVRIDRAPPIGDAKTGKR